LEPFPTTNEGGLLGKKNKEPRWENRALHHDGAEECHRERDREWTKKGELPKVPKLNAGQGE